MLLEFIPREGGRNIKEPQTQILGNIPTQLLYGKLCQKLNYRQKDTGSNYDKVRSKGFDCVFVQIVKKPPGQEFPEQISLFRKISSISNIKV